MSTGTAHAADCGMEDVSARINVLGNEFPAIQAVIQHSGEAAGRDGGLDGRRRWHPAPSRRLYDPGVVPR